MKEEEQLWLAEAEALVQVWGILQLLRKALTACCWVQAGSCVGLKQQNNLQAQRCHEDQQTFILAISLSVASAHFFRYPEMEATSPSTQAGREQTANQHTR